MRFPRITIRLSDDFEREFGPERFSGVLIEQDIAAYLVDGEELAFIVVEPTDKPGTYIATSGHAYGGQTNDEGSIARVVDGLRAMSGWDFYLRYCVRTTEAADFDLIWDLAR
ncbi:hypothetical protein [Brevibacillus reuszeri]|uniref:hypothetical protein n=1 Tax=Brevibacillus reuszeri TaxID=54915 RepID=UPI000CCC9E5C|nr:hypothetical protein [Brevibacillus reuszeri]